MVIATELAKKQREISVSEFFAKNRHLLGFDNPIKALMTAIKEGVDNAMDACEEARVLPDIYVEIKQLREDRFKIIIEDNGPGIVKQQIPRIFAKLLYGSKFHKLSQSLTGDQDILIKKGGKLELLQISQLIDPLIKDEDEILVHDLEVPSFDWKNYKYSFKSVSHLIKHKRRNEIIKIKTLYGNEIKVTGCHSLFTIDSDTLNVKEIEARNLKKGDIVLAPKRLDFNETKNYINVLDYIHLDYARKRYLYLYTDSESVKDLFEKSKVVHYKKDAENKSKKFYRFIINNESIDVLEDSYKQYILKGFIPVWLAKVLNFYPEDAVIRTYFHGAAYDFPVVLSLSSAIVKMLGLFVAKGHTDKRQIGFTFSRHERDLVSLVCDTAYSFGVGYTLEERPKKNSVRLKLFGSVLSYLFKEWFGCGAKNKKIPEFILGLNSDLRQDFLDYLYLGDGHNTKKRSQLMLTTVSKKLAYGVMYLWKMQGILASICSKNFQGLGKCPSLAYVISVYGKDINRSNCYSAGRDSFSRRRSDYNLFMLFKVLGYKLTRELLNYLDIFSKTDLTISYSYKDFVNFFSTSKPGYKLKFMQDQDFVILNQGKYYFTQQACLLTQKLICAKRLLDSDFAFLSVREVERITDGYEFVYDLSVPECENFVGGIGGLACHNSRGQQGIGISAAAMYGQLTTGKGIEIMSKISPKHPAYFFNLHIDTQKNEPVIVEEKEVDWSLKEQGIRIELELEGKYQKGKKGVGEYLRQTALANPHAKISFKGPEEEVVTYPRVVNELPVEPKEIKPHPYGVELGILIKMLQTTRAKNLSSFLQSDFSRVSLKISDEIVSKAKLTGKAKPLTIARKEAEDLYQAIQVVKIIAPPTNCLSPIGEEEIIRSLKKEFNAEFFAACTRAPSVYRGNPFVIEAGIAYGGSLDNEGLIQLMRFANKVPLLYQQGACSINKSVLETAWRNYGLSQSKGALPSGPVVLLVHMASVLVPFTSESKEAIAHYPEIIKETKLALQECGRKLGIHMRKVVKAREQLQKASLFEGYISELSSTLAELADASKEDLHKNLNMFLEQKLPLLMEEKNE